jgi:IS1 family transposase
MAIIKEIIGNRDTKTVKFQDILERLYNRIVEYCTDSLDIISIKDDERNDPTDFRYAV